LRGLYRENRMRNAISQWALVLFCSAPAAALATDVQGNINLDTRWTTAGSPYRLLGDTTVAAQATLTIDPGVIVEAAATDSMGSGANAAKVELVIRGALVANGTSAAPIVFHGAVAGVDSWYGISFEPGARASSVTFAQLSDTSYAALVRSSLGVTLTDLAISKTATGIDWQSAGTAQILRTSIEASQTAIFLEGDGVGTAAAEIADCTLRGASIAAEVKALVNANVHRNHFVTNATGLLADAGSSLVFENNVLTGNTAKGLDLTQTGANAFTITNNTLDRNVYATAPTTTGIGIHVRAVSNSPSFVIRNDTVTSHGVAGIKVDGATLPSLDHNDVWGNTANYVGVTAGTGSSSVSPLFQSVIGGGTPVYSTGQSVSQGAYPNNYSQTWWFNEPGAFTTRLKFTSFSTESCCDHVYIYDVAGTLIATYSGAPAVPFYTPSVAGGRVRVVFTSDGSNTYSGFTIAGYEYAPASYNYRLQPSSPLIDTGNNLDAPADDADGIGRPYDGDFTPPAITDIGAYEWHQNAAPYANAGSDQTVLPGTTVTLNAAGSHDADGTIVAYDWNYGDGSAHGTTAIATHSYATANTYTVTLTVTDDQGATATDTAVVTVATNLPPVANAGADQWAAVGVAVNLDGGGSTDPDGTVVGYSWAFGDGAPVGSGRNVTHAYATAGVYTVTLTVTDNRGATAVDTASMVIGSSSNQAPIAHAGGPYTVTLGQAVNVSGATSSDPDGTIAAYAWDFGDGGAATTVTASHTYATAGTFLLKLKVTDNQGAVGNDSTLVTVNGPTNQPPVAVAGSAKSAQVGQSVSFDGTASHDADGTIVSWDWDFGDGSAHATTATASHAYTSAGTYIARLTVTDDKGATGTDNVAVNVGAPGNQNPVANAGGNKSGLVGQSMALDGSASHDPDGTIASWDWDFGDGSAHASTSVTTHTYATAGAFLVRLTVTDNQGAIGQDVALATVSAPNNQSPIADAGGSKAGTVGEPVTFNGGGSSDPDGTIASYAWVFGDGTSGTGATVTHTFDKEGSFLVRLTVTDNLGATAQDTALATIHPPGSGNKVPIANAGKGQSGTVAEPLTFDGTGSTDLDGTIVSFDWDFGDGATASGSRVTHSYAKAGSYLVHLKVTDNQGAVGDDMVPVSVAAPASPAAKGGGCGCGAGGGSGALLPGLLLARRRRRGAARS
jgi:PKD repeat protein